MTAGEILQKPSIYIKKGFGKIQRRMIRLPEGAITKKINGKVLYEFKLEPFLNEDDFRAMLTSSYDIILCDFLKKHLVEGDIFIDVGANVGYISAVAASYVGTSGEIHSFEPLKECFLRLQTLGDLNPAITFKFNNVALGAESGTLPIAYNPQGDSRNATLVPSERCIKTYSVPVVRLDDYIKENISNPERIKVIKIDVEGFEFPVLKGLERFFTEKNYRPLIVCEVKPWVVSKVGCTLEIFDRYMRKYSYQSYNVLLQNKPIDLQKLRDLEVVLFRG